MKTLEEITFMTMIIGTVVLIICIIAYLILVFNPIAIKGLNTSKVMINRHGLKYRWVQDLGHFYNLQFLDEENKKWIYVYGASIDFSSDWVKYKFQEYKKRSFSSNNNHEDLVNSYRNIEQLADWNNRSLISVNENNKQQERYKRNAEILKKNQGFWD